MYQILRKNDDAIFKEFYLIAIENNKIMIICWDAGCYGNDVLSFDIFANYEDFFDSNESIIFDDINSNNFIFLEKKEALFEINLLLENNMVTIFNVNLNEVKRNVLNTKTLEYKNFVIEKKIKYKIKERNYNNSL